MRMLGIALGAALLAVSAAPAGVDSSGAPLRVGSSATPAAPQGNPGTPAARAQQQSAPHRETLRPLLVDTDPGAELIGRPAPAWHFNRWIRTRPLSLERLRGKAILLRWWTEDCHYCATTLPVLERLRARDAPKGLVVIGVFHPKPPHPVSDRHILSVANRLGFSGPIAVDAEWSTLESYWLEGHPERNWTSVSFLIDRNGVIRWVHGGGEYHPSADPRHASCDLEYRGLEKVLAEVVSGHPARSNSPAGL